MPVITRSEYMKDSARLHQAFYGQFATMGLIRMIARRISVGSLIKSRDQWLNDIPLREWDMLPCQDYISHDLWRQAREQEDKTKFWWSMSDNTCVAKAAARIIIEHGGDLNAVEKTLRERAATA
jgi:hypothetical protein